MSLIEINGNDLTEKKDTTEQLKKIEQHIKYLRKNNNVNIINIIREKDINNKIYLIAYLEIFETDIY